MNNRGFFLSKQDTEMVWHPFALPYSSNIVIKKAKGVYLTDTNNKKYIDAISSWWVNIHGHQHPKLKQALIKQFKKTDHIIFSGFTHEPAIQLSSLLLKKTNNLYDKVFFSDNGSTSVEVAVKLAIQYLRQNKSEKITVLSFENAYHGDTFGAMSAGGKNVFNAVFENEMFPVTQLPLPDDENISSILDKIENIQKNCGAIVFVYEPLIQGSGGMNIYNASHLSQILKSIRKKNSVCIADEVMTGFYRTGTFLASDQVEEKPDLVCLSKGITGGIMPLSVTLIAERFSKFFKDKNGYERFYHGHSYTGNPLACAVAVESFKLLESESAKKIDWIANEHLAFSTIIKSNPLVKNVKTIGTILRFEIVTNELTGYTNSIRDIAYNFFIENGVLLRPLGNVIYIMPPYTIEKDALRKIYKTIQAFLASRENVSLK